MDVAIFTSLLLDEVYLKMKTTLNTLSLAITVKLKIMVVFVSHENLQFANFSRTLINPVKH